MFLFYSVPFYILSITLMIVFRNWLDQLGAFSCVIGLISGVVSVFFGIIIENLTIK